MGFLLAIVLLSSVAFAQVSSTGQKPEQNTDAPSIAEPQSVPGELPPPPKGKSTVIGGTIATVDPILDQLTLKVFGGHPMKILFDERTLVYRDGVKSSLRDLHAKDHASVETLLDGTTVFARSIHMLSKSPEGESEGQILSYDAGTGELTLSDSLSRQSIKLHVPAGTKIVREAQAAEAPGAAGPADLVKGTLISAQFQPDNKGEGVASSIAILAKPGTQFAFTGKVSFLDMRARRLVVVDAQDEKSYEIFFNTELVRVARTLHEGDSVKVEADFDGTRYTASTITPR